MHSVAFIKVHTTVQVPRLAYDA